MAPPRKILKKILGFMACTAAAVVFILAGVLAFLWLDKPLVRKTLCRYLERKTGAAIKITRLDYAFFPLSVRAFRPAVALRGEWGEVELSAEYIGLDGDLWRLVKGDSPTFGDLQIRRADIRIRLTRFEERSADNGSFQRVFEALSRIGDIDISDAKAEISLPRLEAVLDVESLILSNRGPAGYRISLRARDLRMAMPGAGDLWRGPLQAAADLRYDGDLRWSGDIESGPSRLNIFGRIAELPPAGLKTEGSFSPRDGSLSISPLAIDCQGLFKASGKLMAKPEPTAFQSFELDGDVENALWFLTRLKPELPRRLQDVDVIGNPAVHGTVVWETKSGERPRFEGKLEIDGLRLSYPFQNSRVDASVSGSITLRGLPLDVRYSADLRAFLNKWEQGGLKLHGVEVRLPVIGNLFSWTAPRATLAMKNLALSAGRSELALEDVRVKAGRLTGDRQTVALDDFEAEIPGLAVFRGSGRYGLGPKADFRLSFKSSNTDLSLIRSRFLSWLPQGYADWTAGGKAKAGIEIGRVSGRGPWIFSGSAGLSGVNFQNSSSTVVVEGLTADFVFDGGYDPAGKDLKLKGSFKLSRGESLCRDLYIDWSKSPLDLEFALDWLQPLRKIDLFSSRVNLGSIGSAGAEGTIDLSGSAAFRMNVNAAFDLSSLSAWASSLRNKIPAQKIEGRAEGRFEVFMAQKAAFIAGRWNIHKGEFEDRASGFSLSGVEASLPFWIENGEPFAGEDVQGGGPGSFSAAELRTPWETVSPFRLDLSAGKNAFLIRPFHLSFFGGTAEIAETAITIEPGTKSFRGHSALRLKGINLARLPMSKGSIQIMGSLDAGFPQIELTPGKMTFEGEAELKAFSGRAKINHISVVNPFLAGRTLRCDAAFEAVNLEQLTDVVPFGRVTGILRGEIQDLAVSYGQPESFSLRLESVRRKGISQKFSLRAVDSLSVISSGEKTALVSSRWWFRFVSHFRYSKIGIASTLRNDMFTLRGTIVEGGVEYLVKKARFFGINVVNKMPDKTISFKDMVQRLKRVGESQTANEENRPF